MLARMHQIVDLRQKLIRNSRFPILTIGFQRDDLYDLHVPMIFWLARSKEDVNLLAPAGNRGNPALIGELPARLRKSPRKSRKKTMLVSRSMSASGTAVPNKRLRTVL